MDDIDAASLVDLSEVDEARSPRKGKAYSTEFKLKVIKHAKDSKSKNSASKKFGIVTYRSNYDYFYKIYTCSAVVVWNEPFKAKIRELYNLWIMNEDRMEWTVNGNRRPAAMDVYLDWICTAWESLPKEIIAKSSKDCGITVCHDGSEDDLIHCFKEHGQVPEGRLMLQEARAWLDVYRDQDDEIDAEHDEKNGYLSDNSFNFEFDG